MNNEKLKYLFNTGLALAVGLVLASLILGWAYVNKKDNTDVVEVTGSAKKRIKSDLVYWTAGVSFQGAKLADAYSQLSSNIPKIKQYLIEKGVVEGQITISSISSETLHGQDVHGNQTSEIIGYSLSQYISVSSNEVEKIAKISREATELINQGILLDSSAPRYFYTKLGDLKVEMLGEAAQDAKARADQIALSTGNNIGAIRSARMGVMQITSADSTEVSDYGINDTSTIDKDVTAVVKINFAVN